MNLEVDRDFLLWDGFHLYSGPDDLLSFDRVRSMLNQEWGEPVVAEVDRRINESLAFLRNFQKQKLR